MALTINVLHPIFAGEVTGVDLTKPISREEAATIEAGMDRYGVLVFRGQAISDEQQIVFTRNFGELESYNTSGTVRKREDNRLGPGIADLSNLTKDGKIISAEDRVWFFKLGDRLWHSDSSFRPVPAKYSLLSGRTVPSWGGNTEFADMRAAYEALDPRTKEEVAELVCELSALFAPGGRIHGVHAGRDRQFPARAASSGARAEGDRPEILVPVGPCRCHRGLVGP